MKNLPPKIRFIILIVALAGIIGLWYMAWRTAGKNPAASNQTPATVYTNANANTNAPSDFVKTGTVTFNSPGLKENTPYFVFEEPGSPALSKEMTIDENSVCISAFGTLPCRAMKVTLETAYGGQRVTVEGVSRPDGSLLIRKLSLEK